LGADAYSVGERTATPSEPGDKPERRSVYQSRCGAAPRRHRLGPAVPDGAPRPGLTSNKVWGFTKTDQKWSDQLEAATRRDDLQHGTNAAYVRGWVAESSGAPAHVDGQEPRR
jgi:hypothetical protein